MPLPRFAVFLTLCICCLIKVSAAIDDFNLNQPEPKTPVAATETASSEPATRLAAQIAEIAKKQSERQKEFQDELHSLSQNRKQFSDAEYMQKVYEANRDYNEYLNRAVPELIALIKSNRSKPEILEGIILLDGEMSCTLDIDPELVGIVLDQSSNLQLGRLCYQMRYHNHSSATETILKTVATKHPLRTVRGQATYALGEYYRQTARDDLARTVIQAEKATIQAKIQAEKATMLASAEQQFSEVLKNYSDVKSPDGKENLKDLAAISLIRVKNIPNLQVGKPAPEMSGKNLDGRSVKLSDYRGKVVVIVFWGSWCGPCMAMVPEERDLFARTKDKPFVLLGVNCRDPLDRARQTALANQMEWASIWDGGDATDGPIQAAFNVLHWPMVYVLDSHSIIRYIDPRGEELNTAVDELVNQIPSPTLGEVHP